MAWTNVHPSRAARPTNAVNEAAYVDNEGVTTDWSSTLTVITHRGTTDAATSTH